MIKWFLNLKNKKTVLINRLVLPDFEKIEKDLNDTVKEISCISADIVSRLNTQSCTLAEIAPADKYECLTVLYEALNSSEDIICLTDSHSKIIYANKSYLSTYGFTSTIDVIGRYARIVNSGLTDKETFTDMWKTIRAGRSWDGTIINKDTLGNLITVRSSIVPIASHTGTVDYYICIQHKLPKGCYN